MAAECDADSRIFMNFMSFMLFMVKNLRRMGCVEGWPLKCMNVHEGGGAEAVRRNVRIFMFFFSGPDPSASALFCTWENSFVNLCQGIFGLEEAMVRFWICIL